jgi:hypothetical protein
MRYPPSKESYRTSRILILSELILNQNRLEVLISENQRRNVKGKGKGKVFAVL